MVSKSDCLRYNLTFSPIEHRVQTMWWEVGRWLAIKFEQQIWRSVRFCRWDVYNVALSTISWLFQMCCSIVVLEANFLYGEIWVLIHTIMLIENISYIVIFALYCRYYISRLQINPQLLNLLYHCLMVSFPILKIIRRYHQFKWKIG